MEKKKWDIKGLSKDKLIILLILAVFLLLLANPFSGSRIKDKDEEKETQQEEKEDDLKEYTSWMEDRVKAMLMEIDGVTKVKVMLTLKNTGEKIVLKDSPYEKQEESDGENKSNFKISSEEKTVLVSGEGKEEYPYLIQEIQPQVEGVWIMIKGKETAVDLSEIIEAVQVLFPVPAHKIKVMKMESGA